MLKGRPKKGRKREEVWIVEERTEEEKKCQQNLSKHCEENC